MTAALMHASHHSMGLVDEFLRSVVHALGWRTGSALFHALGLVGLLAGALVVSLAVLYRRWRKQYRRDRNSQRKTHDR